jgi:hypothetical protein
MKTNKNITHRHLSVFVLLAAILSLASTRAAHATDFYVNSAVTSNGTGTSATPWKTLNQAVTAINANTIKPGDRVLCKGSFEETITLDHKGTAVDAKAGRYITFANWGAAERPLLTIPNAGNPYANAINIRYCYGIRIEGFEISAQPGSSDTTNRSLNGVGITATRSFFLNFKNNWVHNFGQAGIGTARSGRIVIENNKCWDNSWTSPSDGSGISLYQNFDYTDNNTSLTTTDPNPRNYQNIIRGNACWGNANKVSNGQPNPPDQFTDGNGIIIDDSSQTQDILYQFDGVTKDVDERQNTRQRGGVLIENNICTSNGGRGIHVFISTDVYEINNTCDNNGTRLPKSAANFTVAEASNVVLKNNISYARTGQSAIEVSGEWPTIQNCLIYNGPVCTTEGVLIPLDATNIIGDPKFGNAATGNYALQSGSPAIDNGNSTNTFTTDHFGYPRVQGNRTDIGAHETNYTKTYPNGSAQNIYIEAESASTQSGFSPFAVVNDTGASGGKYITTETAGPEWYNQYQFYYDALYNSPGLIVGGVDYSNHRAEYNFSLPLQGTQTTLTTVNIWLRVRRVNFTWGVLFASVDGGVNPIGRGQFERAYDPHTNSDFNETAWTWVKYRTVKLTSGNHSVKLAKGTSKVQIDRILITSNLTLQP